jgi:hypothetical protein
MSRTAKDIFETFSDRLGWDFEIEADVLVNWCLEGLIEPLLQYIENAGQTDDFEDWLIDNFGVDLQAREVQQHDWQKEGF